MGVGGLGLGLIFDFNVGFTMGIFSSAVYLCFAFWVVVLGVLLLSLRISTPIFFFSLFCLRKTSRKQLIGLLASLFPGFLLITAGGYYFF
jgi:hypothetical protein